LIRPDVSDHIAAVCRRARRDAGRGRMEGKARFIFPPMVAAIDGMA
jgi:hypothetical protein